ncbi:hypothetical protein KY289_030890 [Solanum tuberosum]|nr:hypothetical protein KY289_030890 [Solanum tuberosum]
MEYWNGKLGWRVVENKCELVFGGKSGVVLKDDFPVFYKTSCQRELFVQQVRGTKGDFGVWGLRFRRNFQYWEVNELKRLLDFPVLYNASCQRELFVQQVKGTKGDFGI